MRIAYLDCFSGISGDMFLGAAVDAGVPLEKLQTVAHALGLHAELVSRRVERGGLAATKVDVLIHGLPDRPLDLEPALQQHEHSHSQPHDAEQPHTHSHEAEHAHSHSQVLSDAHTSSAPHVHRGLAEIREIIARVPISPAAQAFALKTFELLAQAEAKIHNRTPESIHFHEVGSEDAIVDIVCSAVAIESLAVDAWYCSALNLGGGTVQCAHGVLPVPAPATAELLQGALVFSSGIQKELLTPTGAALLRALNVRYEPLPPMTLSATGYGAGARDFPGSPNVIRLSLGESFVLTTSSPVVSPPIDSPTMVSPTMVSPTIDSPTSEKDGCPMFAPASSALTWEAEKFAAQDSPSAPPQATDHGAAETITVLEANLDDMNPQLLSYVQQKLLTAGALDAFTVPVQMKKGRPGIVLTVLAVPALAKSLARILLTETTTLGVRMRQEQRWILDREHVIVQSPWGPIRVKLGRLQGKVVNCAPEFEDCRSIAESTGVPLKTILQEALHLYLALPGIANVAADEVANDGSTAADKSDVRRRL